MLSTDSLGPAPQHVVAIAIGSNIGDRQGNVVAALHMLRTYVAVERISPVYETKPVGYADQPDFLNLACTGKTNLAPKVLRGTLAKIERQIGRRATVPLGPRAIDLDLLLYDDRVMQDEDCTIPHPGLTHRAFVLVPLADIAPNLVDPLSGKSIGELAAGIDRSDIRLHDGGLLTRIRRDVQESRPQVPLALNRVGITGVKTLLFLDPSLSDQRSTLATFDIYADLDADHSGVHMSRFSQDLEDALADLAAKQISGIDSLALQLAQRVVESQHAERADVHVRAPLALPRVTPASAIKTTEFYTVLARGVATTNFSRRLLGVEAEGMTACPCAQMMVAGYSRERLAAEGFDERQIEKILAAIPLATHNQRGLGTFMIGADRGIDLAALVEIVEQSMSSETYDLLKRPDELFIVNKAHRAPRFVEDVVREMLRYAHDMLVDFPDDSFVLAKQVNYESIHKHDAVAETCSTLGELRLELQGEPNVSHTSLEEWLRGHHHLAGTENGPKGPLLQGPLRQDLLVQDPLQQDPLLRGS